MSDRPFSPLSCVESLLLWRRSLGICRIKESAACTNVKGQRETGLCLNGAPRCWLDVATFDFFGQALRDDALSTLRKLGKLLHEETEIQVLSFSAECLQLADFVAKASLRH